MITMAFCYNCGSPLGDSDKFCASCGAAVISAQPAAEVPAEQPAERQPAEEMAAEPVAEAVVSAGEPAAAIGGTQPETPVEPAQSALEQPAASEQPTQQVPPAQPTQNLGGNGGYGDGAGNGGASFPGGAYAPQQPGAPQQPPQDFSYQQYAQQGSIPTGQTMVTPAVVPPQSPSPLSRAWSDFKASPNKFKIILKLAAFQFVPGVGGLVTSGYTYTWAKEQAYGKHEPMPHKIVRPGVLDNGLYAYGVSLIISAAVAVAFFLLGALLGAINLDGLMFLLWLAFLVVSGPFLTVMYLRSAICGKVRSGLNVKRAWELFTTQGKTGKAFTSYWGPTAAAAGLCFVALIIFFILFSVVVGAMLTPVAFSGYGMSYGMSDAYYASSVVSSIISSLLGSFPLLAILLFALFFITTTAQIVVARAFGYWMQDFQPRNWPEAQENARYYQNSVL